MDGGDIGAEAHQLTCAIVIGGSLSKHGCSGKRHACTATVNTCRISHGSSELWASINS
jgi:hypothetical protein